MIPKELFGPCPKLSSQAYPGFGSPRHGDNAGGVDHSVEYCTKPLKLAKLYCEVIELAKQRPGPLCRLPARLARASVCPLTGVGLSTAYEIIVSVRPELRSVLLLGFPRRPPTHERPYRDGAQQLGHAPEQRDGRILQRRHQCGQRNPPRSTSTNVHTWSPCAGRRAMLSAFIRREACVASNRLRASNKRSARSEITQSSSNPPPEKRLVTMSRHTTEDPLPRDPTLAHDEDLTSI